MNNQVETSGKDVRCPCCGGGLDEEPTWVEGMGYRFTSPFYCICCGTEICGRQFAYSRTCVMCDMGICQSGHRSYTTQTAHEHPIWYISHYSDGRKKDVWDKFANFVNAIPLEEIK